MAKKKIKKKKTADAPTITGAAAARFLKRFVSDLFRDDDKVPADGLFRLCAEMERCVGTARAEAADALVAYTDGCYSTKTNFGAGAFVLLRDGAVVRKGGRIVRDASGNTAELEGVRRLLSVLPENASVELNTDSQFVIMHLTEERKIPRKEAELVKEIRNIISSKSLRIRYNWVKGHSGDTYNEMCDQLCKQIVKCETNSKNNAKKKKS